MREGVHLNTNRRANLIAHVSDQEIFSALNGIDDMNSPGINGFGARFFKSSWKTIKGDTIVAVHDLFLHERLYKTVKCMWSPL